MNGENSIKVTPTEAKNTVSVTVGEGSTGGQAKTYYASLSVTNQSPNDIEIKYFVNGQEQKQEFPKGSAGGFDVTVQSTTTPSAIEFKAYQKGTTTLVLMNGENSIKVTPTEAKNTVSVTVGEGSTGGQAKTYYASLSVTNQSPNDIEIKYLVNGQEQKQEFPKGSAGGFDVTVQSTTTPSAIEFKAYQKGTTTLVLMNGENSIKVTPTEAKNTVSVTVGEGSTGSQAKTYYASLSVTNQSPNDIEIKYLVNGQEQKQEFPKGSAGGFDVTVQSTTIPSAIEFKAYQKGTTTLVLMNGENSIKVTPTEAKNTVSVTVGEGSTGGQAKTYYASLSVTNQSPNDIQIKYLVNGQEQKQEFPKGSAGGFDVTVQSTTTPSAIEFKAYQKGTTTLVLMNGENSIKVTPTEAKNTVSVTVGEGSTGGQAKTYYASLSVTNQSPNDIEIKYLVNGQEQKQEFPKGSAGGFDVTVQSTTTPSAIEFKAYQKGTTTLVLMNGENSIKVTPTEAKNTVSVTVGEGSTGGQAKTYYASLSVTNQSPNDIEIKYLVNGQEQKQEFPKGSAGGFDVTVQSTTTPSAIEFKAYQKGTTTLVLMNGENSIKVTPTEAKNTVSVTVGEGSTGGQAKTYYASLSVTNQSPNDIEIKYLVNGQEQKQEFPKGSAGGFDVTVQSTTTPSAIEFKAYQKGTTTLVLMNGENSIKVTPTEAKNTVSVTVGEGSTGGQAKTYYASLSVTNQSPNDIEIKYLVNGQEQKQEFPKGSAGGFDVTVQSTTTPSAIEFKAYQKGTTTLVLMNGENSIKVTPTEAKNTVSVTVGEGSTGGQAKTYYASLSVTNQSPNDIEIKYLVNGQEQKQEFPKGSAGGFDVTVQSTTTPSAIEFKAYQKGTTTLVLMNGENSIKVTPTEAKNTVSVTVGEGSTGGQAKTYYASLSVTNQSPNDIEIKYLVNGQEQKQEFPKGSAGGFDVTVQSTTTPSAIEFKAYQKGTTTLVLMNGENSIKVTPAEAKNTVSVTVGEGSTGGQAKTYYASLSVTNQSPNDIEIKYLVNGQEQKQEFPKGSAGGFDVTVQSTTTPSAIEFKAYQKGTTTLVLMNGENSIKVTPTEAKNTVSVTVGEGSTGGQAKTYYASLSVTNQSPNDIEIKYLVNGQEQKQEFPKGSAGGFDVTVQSTTTPSAIEFKAYQKGTTTLVLMNGENSIKVTPTEAKNTVSVTVGGNIGE